MIGELTRACRQRLGLTQEELAERTGLSVRAIRAIETGRSPFPRRGTVELLADAFGLSPVDREGFFAAASTRPPVRPATDQTRAVPPRPPGPDLASIVDTAAPDGRPVPAVPEQLPAAVAGFAGRGAHLHRLDSLLDAGAPATAVISGSAGVGKTTLAVCWGHRVVDRFPDGQLYVNLRGFDPTGVTVTAVDAVRGFLFALGVPPQRVPADLPTATALYRSLMARRRMLVVADNAREADQVRPLIPGAAGCLVLVTSRRQLAGLVATEGALPVTLDLLSVAESRQVLTGRLGWRRVAAEPAAVDELILRCARLPLALAVVAARAAINPTFSLAALTEQLGQTGNWLDGLHGGDATTDVRTVFSWSYRQLSADAARLFRRLYPHPGPDLGVRAAASLAGVGAGEVMPLLAELSDAQLVAESRPGRYGLHDLLRSYAAELAGEEDTADDRRAAQRRMLDHYLVTGDRADRLLAPGRDRLHLPEPAPGAVHTGLVDRRAAMAWFGDELGVLLAAVQHAADTGFDAHAWQLASTLRTYLHRHGRWHEMAVVFGTALRAAERLQDRSGLARGHHHLGEAYANLGRFRDARHQLGLALASYAERGDHAGQARAELALAYTMERQQEPAQALGRAEQALRLARAAGDIWLQARALNAVGWYHALLDEHEQTRAICEQALILFEEVGDPEGAADTWDSIGFANHHLGRPSEAIDCYRRALRLYRELGNRFFEAATLTHLGHTLAAVGSPVPARTTWRSALAILTDLDHPDAGKVRALLRQLDTVPAVGTGSQGRDTGAGAPAGRRARGCGGVQGAAASLTGRRGDRS